MKREISVHFKSEKMDWETPQTFFDKLNAEFHFDCDVAASKENRKVRRYLDKKADALSVGWNGVCWMNPPYGREIGKWMKKAYLESCRKIDTTVVCLVPARTDTAWWHAWACKGEIRFIRGRLKFQGAKSSAPFPSAIVIFRASRKKVQK